MSAVGKPDSSAAVEPPPFKRFLIYFLKLGSLGFGGPTTLSVAAGHRVAPFATGVAVRRGLDATGGDVAGSA